MGRHHFPGSSVDQGACIEISRCGRWRAARFGLKASATAGRHVTQHRKGAGFGPIMGLRRRSWGYGATNATKDGSNSMIDTLTP
jgi:hypothetical protein